ncbi:phosphoesterase RecJ domain protein [mine drainage metagenome]|uniref:Phosphoesterase RecJ domain protein n=1 Tax=mine drainage metagenome TaxID=410659 RepID=T0YEQ5_9ZZZZ
MPNVSFEELSDEIRKLKGKRVMISFHSQGDTDAIASALGISSALPNSSISAPDKVTANSLRIMSKLGFDPSVIKDMFMENAEAIILVDVNNFENCGAFRENLDRYKGPVIIIDHHKKVEDKDNMRIFDEESYNSASSIVYDLLRNMGIDVEQRLAKLIAMGIISDSAEFKNSMPNTFMQLGELFGISKTTYIDLLEEVEHISPASERIKTIEDILMAKAEVHNNLLFMYGNAHAYANLAADDAIKMGADVVIFKSVGSNEVSLSSRLRPTLDKKYGIHLGALMKSLSKIINGTGGGHPCAAGAYGPVSDKGDEFISSFISEILTKVNNG